LPNGVDDVPAAFGEFEGDPAAVFAIGSPLQVSPPDKGVDR
jgi:hypothetical protein